jgi:hypothetical protein
VVVQRTIQDQRLERFAVSGHADDLVLASLVMAVAAEPRFGERR